MNTTKTNKAPEKPVVTTVVAKTTKGQRIWLQGLERHGIHGGARYNVTYDKDFIVITVVPHGKRKVTASKGGIIDLVGKKVTEWAQGSTKATVEFTGDQLIIITKINEEH